MNLKVISPYTGECVVERPYDSEAQLGVKLDRLQSAQLKWRRSALEERLSCVAQGIEYFRANRETIAADVSRQMGKPIRESRGEVDTCIDRGEYCLKIAGESLAPDYLPPKEGFVRRIEHAPLGVVLNIAAWNYPLLIPVNVVVPALLAGNAVLLKHSSKTPLIGEHFERAFGNVGHGGIIASAVVTHEATARVIGDLRVDHVSFTGSVRGGLDVYLEAAKRGIDAGLELGGKDPAYVAADADLEFSAANVVEGACYNAGQSCCAVERVYVHRDIYQAFLERAQAALGDYRMGDPLAEETTLGPLASRSAPAFLRGQVEDAVARGARLMAGGEITESGAGSFFPPTLLAEVPAEAAVMQEESFGPIVPVRVVDDDDEALELMNRSRYGLTASIWTRDRDRAEHFACELQAGTVYQNRCDYLDPGLPWTGWRDSGVGSTLSKYGFHHLTRRKSIHFRDV